MHFLRYIDKLKNEYIESEGIIDKHGFHFYKEIELKEVNIQNEIICLKNQYTFILIVTKEGVKIYLDDYDIVSILIHLIYEHNEIGQPILNTMYKMIEGEGYDFSFGIDDENFQYKGLKIMDSDLQISTKADIEILVSEFIIILNLIFAKETIASKENALKNIICKYICLSEYYGNRNKESEKILKELEFPIQRSLNQNRNIIARAGNNKFVVDINKFLEYKKLY